MPLPSAVLFDLYGTLLQSAPETGRLDDALRARGLLPGPDSYDWLLNGLALARLAEALGLPFEQARDMAMLRPLDSVEELARALAAPGSPPPGVELLRETEELYALMNQLCTLREDAVPLLEHLSASGVSLSLITNITTLTARPVSTLGLKRWFPTPLLSCEVGWLKPDPRIFHAALEALGARPEQAVMVGDSWSSDIVGALRSGLRAVWLDVGRDLLVPMLLAPTLDELREQLAPMLEREEGGRLVFGAPWRAWARGHLPVPLDEVERELSSGRSAPPARGPALGCLRGVTRVTSLSEVTEVLLRA